MDVRTRNALLQPTRLEGQTHQEHSMNASVKLHTAVAATAIVLFTAVSALAETFAPGVGEDGNITLPAEDYRKDWRSEEHTSELQSLMRNSYAVFCLKKKNKQKKS